MQIVLHLTNQLVDLIIALELLLGLDLDSSGGFLRDGVHLYHVAFVQNRN